MKQRSPLTKIVVLSAMLQGLTGCSANPSHLVFYQSAVLGVDVAVSGESGPVHATLGYDRQTTTLIPKTETSNSDGQKENEAMSVVSKADIDIQWLSIQAIHESFATGQAAINIANNPAAISSLSVKDN